MAEMVFPNNTDKIKSALAKLSKKTLDEVKTNTSLVNDLNEVVKVKFGPSEIDDPDSEVSPEEQMKNNSLIMNKHIKSINGVSLALKGELQEIHSTVNSVNNSLTTVNTLLASSALSLMQVNAVLSAFRADFIALNNGVDIKGESYINKPLLKRNSLFSIAPNNAALKSLMMSANKVMIFADLMSNGVRPKIGNTKLARDSDGQGIFSKLLGKLSPDMQEYGQLILQFLPVISMFTGKEIDDSNVKSLASSILGKQKSKQYIDPLNEMIAQWMNGPSNGKMFDIKKLLGGKINELTGLGDDVKTLEKEKNPKKVLVALAPLADDIRDMVEEEFKAYQATPKTLIRKAPYATPVWIVNDPYQENGLKAKDQEETRENDVIMKRFSEMLMGRTTNKRDRDGRELLSIDEKEGMMEGELLKKYLKVKGLEDESYDTQFKHVVGRKDELKKRIDKKRRSGVGNRVIKNENGEYEIQEADTSKFDAVNGMKFENLNNLLSFTNPLNGAINAITEMAGNKENPLSFIKNTIGGSIGEVGSLFSTIFGSHQSGRASMTGKGDTLVGATVHEGEIIKSENNTKITNAIKNLNIVLSASLSVFQSNSFLSRIKSQLLYQTQNGGDIDISALDKPEKPEISKAAINETGKTDAKSVGKSGINTIFSSVKDFLSKLKPKAKKQVHKKMTDLFDLEKKEEEKPKDEKENPEDEKKKEGEEENKDKKEEDKEKKEGEEGEEDKEKKEGEEGKDKKEGEEENKDKKEDEKDKTSSAEPTEPPVEQPKEEKSSKAEATDPNADAQTKVEEEKANAEAAADQQIEANKAAAEERVSSATAEADKQAQDSIQKAQEQSKAEADNKINEIKSEMSEKVDSEREAAQSDADAAREERRKGEEKRNKMRDKAADHVAKKEGEAPTSKIGEIVAKIKKAGSTVIEKIKNSSIVKKIASAWSSLMARLAQRKAGSLGREGMRKTSLIKRIVMKIKGKAELAAGEVASEQTNLAMEDAAEGPSLISELTGAVSGAVAKITDAIPFPPGVGKIAAAAIGVAAAAGIIGAGIKFLKKIKKGKKGGGGDDSSKAQKDSQKQAKDAKRDAKKKKEQEDKKEEAKTSTAEASQAGNVESEISKSKSENNKLQANGKTSSTGPEDPILSLFDKKEQKLMSNVMNSSFGKDMMKDPSKSSGFMFNMQAGDKIGFKNASTSALSKLAKGAAKVGSGFTEAMFSLTSKLLKDKKKYTDDLSDKSKNKSENANLEYSKANLAKAARKVTDKMLKKYDLDVIEGKSLSEIKSELYQKNQGKQANSTTSSPMSSSSSNSSNPSREVQYMRKYSDLSQPYKDYLNNGEEKHEDFSTWVPSYYEKLKNDYGISSSNSTTNKKLSDEMNKDFLKDLTTTTEWLLLDKNVTRKTKLNLEKVGFNFNDWVASTSNASVSSNNDNSTTGKAKYGMSIYSGLGRIKNDPLSNDFLNASSYALRNNYKEKNGGTYPSFFNSYLSKSGINVNRGMSNDEIKKQLAMGNPVILMGSDSHETGKTPFGSEPHYVVATGYDGKNISIEDPDEPQGSIVYNANSVLRNSSIKLGTNSDTSSSSVRSTFSTGRKPAKKRLGSSRKPMIKKGRKIRVKNSMSSKQSRNNAQKFRVIHTSGKSKYGRSKYGKGYANTIWTGDSRTVGLSDACKVQAVAKSGETIKYFTQHYSELANKEGYNIICWFGVNGPTESHAKACAVAYNKLAEDLKGKSDIYVCTIGKCYNDSGTGRIDGGSGQSIDSFNKDIVEFNKILLPLLSPDIKTIDLCSYIDQISSTLGGKVTRDNLHYNKEVYEKINEYVNQTVLNGVAMGNMGSTANANTGEVAASVEWSMKSYLNEDELQQYVTKKGKYTRAYEEALAAAEGRAQEETGSETTPDESIVGDVTGDTSGVTPTEGSSAIPTTLPTNNPTVNGTPSNTDINNIINNVNNIIGQNLGTTIVKNDIKPVDPEDMKDILAYFKELNEIQDDSLDVLEIIYEKLRKKKGKPKENFNIGPELVGTHGRRYGV